MKLYVLALLGASCIAGAANAADLGSPYTRQALPQVNDAWTGFYIGGGLGATFANGDMTTDVFSPFLGYDSWSSNVADSSFSGGFYAGYNHQIGSFVLGLETEANWLNASFSARDDSDTFATSDWQFAVSGRLGYLLTPATLLYAKAGWAFTEVSINGTPYARFQNVQTSDGYRNGALLGIGIETLFAESWLVRVEGEYTVGTQSAHVTLDDIGMRYSIQPDFLAARIGVAYKF